jgi:hypothetical protein
MDKLHEFISRNINVLDLGDGLRLGRESSRNMDYMTISYGEEILFSWWNNPQKKVSKNPPKHTGGRPSYVKQFLKEMEKHVELSVEAAGLIQKVIPNISWGNNLIIDKRSKKTLVADDLCKIINKSKPVTLKIIKELTTAQLLSKDKDGYKISPNLIQKGGAK